MSEVNGHSKKVLPEGWKWVTFNDVCTKIGDIDHKMPKTVENGYPYVSTKDLTNELKVSFDNVKYISKEDFHLLSKKIKPERGDIIFPRYGTIGKNILVDFDKEFLVSYSCAIVKPNPAFIKSKFFYFYSLSPHVAKEIKKYVVETTQANIGIASIKRFVLPLPPLPVQEQIVSKMEELFSELDKSIEQLKTAQQQLKVYRQSVLKWAFEGKLTNENVKEGELPILWKFVKVEEIASVGTGATPLKGNKEYYENGEVPWITSGALNNEYVNSPTEYVTQKALKETNLSIYPKHTLLLAMYGEGKTRGKCSELLIDATTNQAIAAIHFTKHDIRVKPFLKYFLLKNYNDIRRLSSGGVQPNLNLGIVKKTILPFPPLAEQDIIIQKIESRLSIADKLEETITRTLQQADVLKQSILKNAFEGRLLSISGDDLPHDL